MAYDATVAVPHLMAQNLAGGRKWWTYSSADAHATVDASGYFTDGYSRGMRDGDLCFVYDTGNKIWSAHTVLVSGTTVNIANGTNIGISTDSD